MLITGHLKEYKHLPSAITNVEENYSIKWLYEIKNIVNDNFNSLGLSAIVLIPILLFSYVISQEFRPSEAYYI